MESATISNISISILLVYFSLTSVVIAFILARKLSPVIKIMWITFVLMVPFVGSFVWLLIQSFEHKFHMDGGYGHHMLEQ